jgi:hypothetical protein
LLQFPMYGQALVVTYNVAGLNSSTHLVRPHSPLPSHSSATSHDDHGVLQWLDGVVVW